MDKLQRGNDRVNELIRVNAIQIHIIVSGLMHI